MKSCCEKVGVLRERIEAMAMVYEEVVTYLKGLEDQDDFTVQLLLEKLDDVEYENDKQLPEAMVCEHERRK